MKEGKSPGDVIFVCNELEYTVMRIDILSVVPELLESPLSHSIIKRARDKGIVEIHIHNIRDWSKDKFRKVDDYPFGGEAGLVMMIQPVYDCIMELTAQRHYDEIIYTAPDAPTFNQKMANELSLKENLMILCGHYKGIDQRVRDHLVTREISVGDYVLTGGELPVMVMIDVISRLIPGVLGNEASADSESFENSLLEYPQYTRPEEFMGEKVPGVLLSGHHANIERWRRNQSLLRTLQVRPDLLKKARLDKKDLEFLRQVLQSKEETEPNS